MSHQHSACIPPPTNYTPRAGPPQSSRCHNQVQNRRGKDRTGRRCRQIPSFQTEFQEGNLDSQKIKTRDKFHRNDDDDYFASVSDDGDCEGANSDCNVDGKNSRVSDSDTDDPLDAYMKSLGKGNDSIVPEEMDSCKGEAATSSKSSLKPYHDPLASQDLETKGVRLDIDEFEDIEESYYDYVEQTLGKNEVNQNDDRLNLVEYDNDGNVIGMQKMKKDIDPLPFIDHSKIIYEPFNKSFYHEHEEIKNLTQDQSESLRSKLDIKVSGNSPPKPVCSFAHFKFDEKLMKVIRRSEYTQPTPIQAQAIPAALSGRNIIGIAMTGSGKTAAYLWPMIVHIMGQPNLKKGDGPIGLVLVPTRELALQVYSETKKFCTSYNIAVVCAYGGGSKFEQSKDLESGAEIVVATPGRMIDLVKMKVTNLGRVTYLVLDEADRFFEMGFEAQVRSICDQIRPDRQTLLFSATFKKKIEQLARTVTDNPVKIVQKALGEANEDVTQHVVVFPNEGLKKWDWLMSHLVEFTSAGGVLIFVTRISNSEELHKNLEDHGKKSLLLHGDMEQSERNRVITSFKRKEVEIMIATDVAARGLDIAHLKTVINYDVARDIDTHIHRVGRTGRAGSKGDAYTLVTEKDKDFAGHLVRNLESSNQEVSADLIRLAMQSHSFRKSRNKSQYKSGHHHKQNLSHRKDHHKGRSSGDHNATVRPVHHQHQHQHQHQHHHYHHHHHHRHSYDYDRSPIKGGLPDSRDDKHTIGQSQTNESQQKRPRWQ